MQANQAPTSPDQQETPRKSILNTEQTRRGHIKMWMRGGVGIALAAAVGCGESDNEKAAREALEAKNKLTTLNEFATGVKDTRRGRQKIVDPLEKKYGIREGTFSLTSAKELAKTLEAERTPEVDATAIWAKIWPKLPSEVRYAMTGNSLETAPKGNSDFSINPPKEEGGSTQYAIHFHNENGTNITIYFYPGSSIALELDSYGGEFKHKLRWSQELDADEKLELRGKTSYFSAKDKKSGDSFSSHVFRHQYSTSVHQSFNDKGFQISEGGYRRKAIVGPDADVFGSEFSGKLTVKGTESAKWEHFLPTGADDQTSAADKAVAVLEDIYTRAKYSQF